MSNDPMATWAAEETDLATLQSMRVAMRSLYERRIRERERAQADADTARSAADQAMAAAEHALSAEGHVRARLVVLDQRVRERRDAIDPPMLPDIDVGEPAGKRASTVATMPLAPADDPDATVPVRSLGDRGPSSGPGNPGRVPEPGDPGYDAYLAQQASDAPESAA